MLLNQDQDLLADLSIAICSSLKASSIQIPDALALFSQADKEDTMLKVNDNWISLRLHCDKMEVGTPCRLTNLAGTHAEIQR